jgi:hypothetical protein
MRSTFFVSACAILLAGSAVAQEASPVGVERDGSGTLPQVLMVTDRFPFLGR